MTQKILQPKEVINKAYRKVKPIRSNIESFKSNLIRLIEGLRRNFMIMKTYKSITKKITEAIQNIFNHISKKFEIFLSIFIFILLHKPIEAFLINPLVNYVFSYIDSIWINDIVFSLLFLLVLLFHFIKYKNRVAPSYLKSFLLFSISILYIFYRAVDMQYAFTPFTFLENLYYSDLLIIASISYIPLLFLKKARVEPLANNLLFNDAAWEQGLEDFLGYSHYAKTISDKIRESKFSSSFAIGINGKWGSGKTSFLKMLEANLSESNIIHIHFMPWKSNSPNAIIQDFFDSMREAIIPFHGNISRLILNYSEKLIKINDNSIAQSLYTSALSFAGTESLNRLFNKINDGLQTIDKKIIIYIDDLDRLDKEELLEVIKLVRNTANFFNAFFIVAYDRNYVIEAIKKQNLQNSHSFLEKIFQLEISLPYFDRDILKNRLLKNLKSKLPGIYHQELEQNINSNSSSYPSSINDNWFENLRDVTRFSNSFLLNSTNLLGEVNLRDLLMIEQIRIKFPSVYSLVSTHSNEYLEPTKSGNKFYFKLKELSINDKEKYKESTYLEHYLKENFESLSVPVNEIGSIISFLNKIFSINFDYEEDSNLSISIPRKFRKYFAYNLLPTELSESEFKEAIKSDLNTLKKIIKVWVEKGWEFEVEFRLYELKKFINKEEYEKIIQAIFYFANLKSLKKSYYYGQIVSYDEQDLYEKTSNYDNRLSNSLYNGNNHELCTFIRNSLSGAPAPYLFEAFFIDYLHNIHDENYGFPLSKLEIKNISYSYLLSLTDSSDNLNENIWNLFFYCVNINLYSSKTGESIPGAKELKGQVIKTFIKFIEKDLDNFILLILQNRGIPAKRFSINKDVLQIFNDWTKFEQFLNRRRESPSKYLKDFKKFFKDIKNNQFNEIEFAFKIIPVDIKILQLN